MERNVCIFLENHVKKFFEMQRIKGFFVTKSQNDKYLEAIKV